MIKKNLKFWKTLPVYTTLAIVIISMMSLGCSSLKIEKSKKNSSDSQEFELVKKGYEAFVQTDYEKAARIYDSLYKQSQNTEVKRWALYGLACTCLITAENTIQHDKAIGLWNKWKHSVSNEFAGEDPRLLGPYIQMTDPPCKKEAEVRLLIKKNDCLKKEILTLKHQITSLEAIDQKIEKKKKEISSP